ncbi:MAG: glycerol-3-phosphate acyltransferase [Anaerolineales bacterium]|jgi:glycerol-3-phosphate acyltransferase PlsY
MLIILYALGFGLFGYLCGSLPFAVWITRLVGGVEVRAAGSGHATTTNVIRQAGFLPGAAVFILDVSKGFVPTWLALHYAPAGWIAALTAALAVVGHCWPLFAGFRGGMGLAPANGGMMAAFPFAILITYALVGLLTLILHHSARASLIAGLLIAPLLWTIGLRGLILWIAGAVGLVVALRFLIDWNRKYREPWLDREKKT